MSKPFAEYKDTCYQACQLRVHTPNSKHSVLFSDRLDAETMGLNPA
jgi:hypothetical protein